MGWGKKKIGILLGGLILLGFILLPGVPKFEADLSSVLYDESGELLGARVSADEQWRFPPSDSVPITFEKCILNFEDEYFSWHLGVNPMSLIRATFQNIRAGGVVSGASTISMQVIRLSRKNRPRNIWEKLIEIVLAIRMELSLSKAEILSLYSAYAPFGGNVVGLEAASWRYFGRPPQMLSWGEAASLAVLPNAPSIVYPGKYEETYLKKRNDLLDKLLRNEIIDTTTCELAKTEELPAFPKRLPDLAPHLLGTLSSNLGQGQTFRSSINRDLQERMNQLIDRYHKTYHYKEVHNAAILVLDNERREVIAYVGNTNCNRKNSGKDIDIIQCKRSTGSLLKPLLYAAAIDDGRITQKSVLPDIPTQIAGFAPKNFNKKFTGAAPADDALTRSLNVPAVLLLQQYGLEKFTDVLSKMSLNSIDKGPEHYGLSIILGGAESKLFELTTTYADLMNVITSYNANQGSYGMNAFEEWTLTQNEKAQDFDSTGTSVISAGAISIIFEALSDLQRPNLEGDWKMFESSNKIAWKTGTSYGLRDAWSIGTSKKYTIGVWVGNSTGEGRPGLVGLEMAAPIMFEAFNSLPNLEWFEMPHDDLKEIVICSKSGFLMGSNCPENDTVFHTYYGAGNLEKCSYHHLLHLDNTDKWQVTDACYEVADMHHKVWYTLPPNMESFYTKSHPDYVKQPPFMEGCHSENNNLINLIYPKHKTVVVIPVDLDGNPGEIIFEAAHQHKEQRIHWHIDQKYIQSTKGEHKISILPAVGQHLLTLVDNHGNSVKIEFSVVE